MAESFKCLCCLDTGLLTEYVLYAHLGIKNSPYPKPYACLRCNAHLNFKAGIFERLVSPVECQEIHKLELERRQETTQGATIARLKAKVECAAFLKKPDLRRAAIAEAELLDIPLSAIGVKNEPVAAEIS